MEPWLKEFGGTCHTLDVLSCDCQSAAWGSAAANHVLELLPGKGSLALVGYSLGCCLLCDLYYHLSSLGIQATAVVVVDYPASFPIDAMSFHGTKDDHDLIACIFASPYIDEPWRLPYATRQELKRLLLAIPGMEERFRTASFWARLIGSEREKSKHTYTHTATVDCPTLLLCSSDPHPMFAGSVLPGSIAASWQRVCKVPPAVHLQTNCHHLSILTCPWLGYHMACFLWSSTSTSVSLERCQRAFEQSSKVAGDLAELQEESKRSLSSILYES